MRPEFTAPSYQRPQSMKEQAPRTSARSQVYPDLEETLAEATVTGGRPDPRVEHVLASLSGYAYSDEKTVTTIAQRLGLEKNRCLRISQDVDAMFIRSTAYLLQSEHGRVAILCYRGTEPANLINWLTDADVSPKDISLSPMPGERRSFWVHGGFYRNVGATEVDVVNALRQALAGKSIVDEKVSVGELKVLYITGHSLGGAMAAMMGTLVKMDPQYQDIANVLRGVYTFGQPMIGEPRLASECDKKEVLGDKVFRYIYHGDVVPTLPPFASGRFAHFGREFRYRRSSIRSRRETWVPSKHPTGQLLFALAGVVLAILALFARMFWFWRWIGKIWPSPYSLYDHEPQHYIAALTPDEGVHGRSSESPRR